MNKKKIYSFLRFFLAFSSALIIGFVGLTIMSNMGRQQIHPDGNLWVMDNEGEQIRNRVYERKFNHEQIQCLCEYLKLYGHKCSDYFPGCGATNCECFVNGTQQFVTLKDRVAIWSSFHDGYWQQGQGIVCT